MTIRSESGSNADVSAFLTGLQLQVIEQLRLSGHTALAAEAFEAWLSGRALDNVFLGGDPHRRAEFDRANEQARKPNEAGQRPSSELKR